MDSQAIIDSHVHLWPASAANTQGHSWMSSVTHLAKQYSIREYIQASSTSPIAHVSGFVYVETDRALGLYESSDVQKWAKGGLDEVAFLRRIVEGTPAESQDEGFEPRQGDLLKGAVIWAPLDRGPEDAREYVKAVREVAGERTWKRIKGFRFLLQGLRDAHEFGYLVANDGFIESLREMGKIWSFDVGVDQRQGGVWQLEKAAHMIERVRKGVPKEDQVVFILNHLCKPNMHQHPETPQQKSDFDRWTRCMERLSGFDKVYMKLSGAFSELTEQSHDSPTPVKDIVTAMKPWLDVVFRCFTPQRLMFGSDWPVCNVVGPGDELSWRHWVEVVNAIMDDLNLNKEQRDRIWYGTAVEAYRLKV